MTGDSPSNGPGTIVRFGLLVVVLVMLLASLPFPFGPASAKGLTVADDISTDTTWGTGDSPVQVTVKVSVLDGVTLTIQPGVSVEFKAGSGLTVEGTLKASGVNFTSSEAVPTAGSWEGITFRNADQAAETLVGIGILHGNYGIQLYNSSVNVQGGSFEHFKYGGVYNDEDSTATVRDVKMFSDSGIGLQCFGPITASGNTIIGEMGVSLSKGCTGTIERNVFKSKLTGLMVSEGSDVLVKENLVQSMDEGETFGALIGARSKVTMTRNDFIGHLYGINLKSNMADINGNNFRSYSGYGVFSDDKTTVDDAFWDTPDPKSAIALPSAGNDDVTITNPRTEPIDIPGIDQPPSVTIVNYGGYELVKGEIMITGQVYEPDPNDGIDGVVVRIVDIYDGVISDWSYADGYDTFVYYWDTDELEAGAYLLEFKVEQREEYSPVSSIYLTVSPLAEEKVHLEYPTKVTEKSITVTWSYQDSSDFKTYRVYYSPTPITDTSSLTPKVITSFLIKTTTITGLEPSTRYFVMVEVETDSGMRYASNQVDTWTDDVGTTNNLNLLSMFCILGILSIVIIVVIVVVVAYVLFIRPKKKAEQATSSPPPRTTVHPQPVSTQGAAPVQTAPAMDTKVEDRYIIEDVFLVYKDGRLIHHDTRRLKPDMDDQMLSGMFTAIQEFVKHSLGSIEEETSVIKEIMYGESRIVLEHGNYIYLAVLATEIKDTSSLHERLSSLVNSIEGKFEDVLADWDGSMGAVKEAGKMTRVIFTDDPIE